MMRSSLSRVAAISAVVTALLVTARPAPLAALIDPQLARSAANSYLDQVAASATQEQMAPRTDNVTVALMRAVRPKFLSLLKVQPFAVRAAAQARPCTVADAPTCQ
jgi:hypothetical protein